MTIDDYLKREIDLGSFPAASYAIGTSRSLLASGTHGHGMAVPLRLRATDDTLYDCASLTKPLITATLVLQAVAAGTLSLDEEYRGATVREMLTHTSGLKAWLPLYAFPDPYEAIAEHGRECERGTRAIYSDLNFILLWRLLEERCGEFTSLAQRQIFDRLNLSGALLRPPAALKPQIAATEWGQRHEMKMCAERKIDFNGFRRTLIWGETHDGNSHHVGAGCAGNAGLFATARAVFALASAFLSGELVPVDLVREATRNHTAQMDDGRGLGWQMGTGSAATEMLSPGNFGHTGFTGTSCWYDPDRDRLMVLLTNRVHPCAAPIAMQKIRGEFHRLALRVSA